MVAKCIFSLIYYYFFFVSFYTTFITVFKQCVLKNCLLIFSILYLLLYFESSTFFRKNNFIFCLAKLKKEAITIKENLQNAQSSRFNNKRTLQSRDSSDRFSTVSQKLVIETYMRRERVVIENLLVEDLNIIGDRRAGSEIIILERGYGRGVLEVKILHSGDLQITHLFYLYFSPDKNIKIHFGLGRTLQMRLIKVI